MALSANQKGIYPEIRHAIDFIRQGAFTLNVEGLPQTEEEAMQWNPPEWVVKAVLAAYMNGINTEKFG